MSAPDDAPAPPAALPAALAVLMSILGEPPSSAPPAAGPDAPREISVPDLTADRGPNRLIVADLPVQLPDLITLSVIYASVVIYGDSARPDRVVCYMPHMAEVAPRQYEWRIDYKVVILSPMLEFVMSKLFDQLAYVSSPETDPELPGVLARTVQRGECSQLPNPERGLCGINAVFLRDRAYAATLVSQLHRAIRELPVVARAKKSPARGRPGAD